MLSPLATWSCETSLFLHVTHLRCSSVGKLPFVIWLLIKELLNHQRSPCHSKWGVVVQIWRLICKCIERKKKKKTLENLTAGKWWVSRAGCMTTNMNLMHSPKSCTNRFILIFIIFKRKNKSLQGSHHSSSLWVGGQISFWLTAELAKETSYSVNKPFLVTMAPKHKNMQEFRDKVVAKCIVLAVLLITSLTL